MVENRGRTILMSYLKSSTFKGGVFFPPERMDNVKNINIHTPKQTGFM
jgi:hypothetical protein